MVYHFIRLNFNTSKGRKRNTIIVAEKCIKVKLFFVVCLPYFDLYQADNIKQVLSVVYTVFAPYKLKYVAYE